MNLVKLELSTFQAVEEELSRVVMASNSDEKAAEYRRLAREARASAARILPWDVRTKLLVRADLLEAWAETAERQGQNAPDQCPEGEQ